MHLCFRKTGINMALLILLASISPSSLFATEPPTPTVITVGEMCGGCVKKISKRFEKVTEIANVKCDIAKKTVTIVPAKDAQLDPRKLWDAMDEIGKTPTKLVSPRGTFTSKPKS